MPPPDKEQVRLAIEAMNTDITMWKEVAADCRSAAGVGARLDLSNLHFTYLGDKAGLVDAYRNLQDRLVSLAEQAAANYDSVAGALAKAATDYKAEDEAGKHAIEGATY
jgi:hypothetical protein